MKRLTTDSPDGNFETMLNYVYGKNGFAHIRFDGEHDDVPLTRWAKAQCLLRVCDESFLAETPEEIDELLCDCMMDCPECPIALAYCFAGQAVHMRSRLKRYEDILFDEDGKERITIDDLRELTAPDAPLTLEELRKLDREPVWIERSCGFGCYYIASDGEGGLHMWGSGGFRFVEFRYYGKEWIAYRCKPEEAVKC